MAVKDAEHLLEVLRGGEGRGEEGWGVQMSTSRFDVVSKKVWTIKWDDNGRTCN